ncbi:hypothetical protein Tco_1492691 [Tanacetum coccineum]
MNPKVRYTGSCGGNHVITCLASNVIVFCETKLGAVDGLDGTERGYQRLCVGADVEDQVDQTQSTGFKVSVPDKNNGKTSSKVEPDTQTLLLTTAADVQALLLSYDELDEESDHDVFEVVDEIDEDIQQADEEETQDQFEPPQAKKTDASDSESLSCSKSLKPYDNYMPITERNCSLKVIQDAVKEDPALNKKVLEATKAYIKKLANFTELLSLVKGFDFLGLKSFVAAIKSHISSLKQDTSKIKSMMFEIFNAFKGQTPPSSSVPTTTLSITEIINITLPKQPESPPVAPQADRGKGKVHDDAESGKKLVKASIVVRPDPDGPVRVPYMIHGKMYQLTTDEIQEHLDKEEKIKKAVEDAKLLAMSKPKLIKDGEIKVLNKEHAEKIKRSKELRKKRIEKYQWTTSSRLNPETITDVKIHPNTKPVAMTDELREIIPKKKNLVVKDLMKSLSKRFKRPRKIPKELGIQSVLPALALEQASSQLSRRKRKIMELEPETRIHGIECNRSLPEGVPFVSNMVIKEPEYGMFFINVFGGEAFQRMNDMHKVDIETLLTYLVMASNITTPKNQRFCLKLRAYGFEPTVNDFRGFLNPGPIEMAFGNFVVAGNDKDMSFIIKSKNEESFGIGSPSVSVNNNDVDAAPTQPKPLASAPSS